MQIALKNTYIDAKKLKIENLPWKRTDRIWILYSTKYKRICILKGYRRGSVCTSYQQEVPVYFSGTLGNVDEKKCGGGKMKLCFGELRKWVKARVVEKCRKTYTTSPNGKKDLFFIVNTSTEHQHNYLSYPEEFPLSLSPKYSAYACWEISSQSPPRQATVLFRCKYCVSSVRINNSIQNISVCEMGEVSRCD